MTGSKSLGDVGFLLFFRVVSGDETANSVFGTCFFGMFVRIVKVKISLVLANMNPGVASLGLLLALLVVEQNGSNNTFDNKFVPNRKMLAGRRDTNHRSDNSIGGSS